MQQPEPQDNTYMLVAQVLGQVGCLLTVTIGGSIVLGLVLDGVLGTRPLFTFVAVLITVPLNLWLIYRYSRYKARTIQAATSQKEDDVSA